MKEEREHDHGHDHGHSHDHGHAHDHAPAGVSISVEETPNPNAMKFVVGQPVGSMNFGSADEAAGHALGRALFAVDGVKSVFAVKDFVTVTKQESAQWGSLAPRVTAVLERELG
jgi:hypothetical protein